MPKTLAEAVDLVRRDLRETRQKLDIELVDHETQQRLFPKAAPDNRVVGFSSIGYAHSERFDGQNIEYDASADPTSVCVLLADSVQDRLIVWSDDYWPRCPLHDHPLSANVDAAGTPVWICPTLRVAASRIGDLAHAALVDGLSEDSQDESSS